MSVGVRVLVACRGAVLRAGVAAALEGSACVVVAEAADQRELMTAALAGTVADVCLLDTRLTLDLGPCIRDLRRCAPGVAVAVLADEHDDAMLIAAVRAGATAYLVSDLDLDQLPHAISALAAGEAVIPRRFVHRLLREISNPRGAVVPARDTVPLTERESEVLELLRAGWSTTRIAAELFIAPVTVRTHVASLVHKLHVADRSGLVTPR